MGKAKTIDLQLITDISVFLSVLPILAFLLFRRNWKDKLKWVCFIYVVSGPIFDIIAVKASRQPVATGNVLAVSTTATECSLTLIVVDGSLHKGQLFVSESFRGIIKNVESSVSKSRKDFKVVVEKTREPLRPGVSFRVHSNQHIENIHLLVESTFFFILFFLAFPVSSLWRKFVISVIPILFLVWVARNLLLGKIHLYDANFSGGTTLLIILFALAYFYIELKTPTDSFIYTAPTFWIVASVLVFKAGTFFLFLYLSTLQQKDQANFYVINPVLNIIKNVLISVAFLLPTPSERKLSIK